jgi:cobyrinic acid a,c-diamide synthase
VGSERHFKMLQEVCNDVGIECFGYLPKDAALEQSSRYLGLDFSSEPDTQALTNLLEAHVHWNALLKLKVPTGGTINSLRGNCEFPQGELSVLIAQNADSFTFIYQETVGRLGNVRFFDPESDVPDFSGIDLLYLPGGYPEKHLEALVANEACRRAIKDYAERGGRIQAECGGMMYLCEQIMTDDGEYPMCGVLPYSITACKADRKLSLGYRRFVLDGKEYRGHEFHYTQFMGKTPPSIVQVYNAKGERVTTPVFRYKNVLASYTHLYEIIG